jgi:hypothetical protein
MAASKKKTSVAKKAPAKKAAKKVIKKTTKKPVQDAAPSQPSELEELRALRDETSKQLEALKKEREDLQRERGLERLNQQIAAGEKPEVVKHETERERIAREREEARQERRRRRQEERDRQRQGATVSSLEEERAKRGAPPQNKLPLQLPLPELHKWKLQALSKTYQEELKRIQEPLRAKYAQMLRAESHQQAQRDEKCVAANKAQVECVNELVALLTPEMPDGYAIVEVLAEQGIVICKYVPERAGKPLDLPGVAPGKKG